MSVERILYEASFNDYKLMAKLVFICSVPISSFWTLEPYPRHQGIS